jgi:hypothetical protein
MRNCNSQSLHPQGANGPSFQQEPSKDLFLESNYTPNSITPPRIADANPTAWPLGANIQVRVGSRISSFS